MKRFLIFSSLAVVLALMLVGCGGGTPQTQKMASRTPTFLTAEDAPLPSVLAFNVGVNSITLNGNGTNVDLLTQPTTVDFARLLGLRTLLAFNSVPAGTYNSITFTLSNPVITYLNLGTTPPSAATITGSFAQNVSINANGQALITVALAQPVTVSGSGLVGLHMHFDLRNSLALDGAGQITGSIDPHIRVRSVAPSDDDAQITDMRGSVVSVNTSANTFLMQRMNGMQITVAVNANTRFSGGSSLGSLVAGNFVEVEGQIQADGSILAREVELVAIQRAFVAGPVIAVSGAPAQSITILVGEMLPTIPGAQIGLPLTLDVSQVQDYGISGIDNWLTNFLFNANSIVAGQRVAVGGTIDSSTNPATFVPQGINLRRQGVEGDLVSGSVVITSGNAGSFQIQNNGMLGYVLSAPLTVKTSNNTMFMGVNGLAGLQAGGSMRLAVRGLILKDPNTGQTTMFAHWVKLLQ